MADVTPTTAPQDDDAAWGAQYDQQQAAAKSQELLPKQEAPHPFQAVSNWVSSLPNKITSAVLDQAVPAVESVYNSKLGRADRDIVAGATTGVKNVADAAVGVVNKASRLLQPMAEAQGAPVAQTDVIPEPIWSHAKSTVQDFTDAVKVKDPGIADNLLQYTAQVAPSYLLAGRLLNELHGVANVVASGAAADASALDPHAPRFADILGVLKQTDGKIGQALRAAGPYGLNAYINYLGSNANETEAQGRFKNALDGIIPNFIGTELLHAAGITVKQGYAGLRYSIDNGVGSSSELATMAAQRGAVGDLSANGRPPLRQDVADPADALYEQKIREDMDAAAANPNGKRPPLRQGADPADSLFQDHIREEMAAAPVTADVKVSGAEAPTSIEGDRAIRSARALAQQQSASGGEGSTHDMVTALAQHMDGSTDDGAFYKAVFSKLSGLNLKTPIVPPGTGVHPLQEEATGGLAGQHSPWQDSTALYAPAFKSNINFVHTLAHESVHAATMKTLAESPKAAKALDVLRQYADSANKTLVGHNARYGFTNVNDFVAELESKPAFQKAMMNTVGPDGKRSVWEHYKDNIAGILGLSSVVAASPLFDKLLTRENRDGRT